MPACPAAASVDEPDRKPCLAPTVNTGGRLSVCNRPCVGMCGSGVGSDSEEPPNLGAWMDAVRPRLPILGSNYAPCASNDPSDDAPWLRGGA